MSNASWPSETSGASQPASASTPTSAATPPPEQPPSEAGAASGAPEGAATAEKTPEQVAAEARQAKLAKDAEFIKRRHGLSAKAKALAEKERALKAKESEANARIAALEKRLAEAESKSNGNPLLREDVDPNALIREFVAKGTPEAQVLEAIKRAEAADKRASELEKKLEADAKAREEAEKKRQAEAQAATENAAITNAVRYVTSDAAKKELPYLNARWTPEEVEREFRAVHERAKQTPWRDPETGEKRVGVTYTVRQVAEYLEKQCKAWHDGVQDRMRSLGLATPPVATPAQTPPKASPGKAPAKSASKGRVLTPDEQREEDLAAIRRGFEADRIAANKKK